MSINVSAINPVLNQIFRGPLANQLNLRVPFLSRLTKTIGGGKNIAFNVTLASSHSAGSYGDGDTITGDGSTTDVPAILNWKYNKAEFKVTGPALAIAATAGPEALSKLLTKEINQAGRDLALSLASQVYGDGTGNTGKDVDGLGAAIADSGTYAGISRVTYPKWRATVLGNASVDRALTKALMDEAERKVFIESGFQADLIVTTPAIYNKFEALFDQQVRINGQDGTYNLGAKEVTYKGIPVMRDQNCPAGHMYFITFDSMEFEQLPPVQMVENMQLVDGLEPLVMEDGSIGLQVAIELLGKTGDFYNGFVKLYGNLKVEHPNRNAVIVDIDEAA